MCPILLIVDNICWYSARLLGKLLFVGVRIVMSCSGETPMILTIVYDKASQLIL